MNDKIDFLGIRLINGGIVDHKNATGFFQKRLDLLEQCFPIGFKVLKHRVVRVEDCERSTPSITA